MRILVYIETNDGKVKKSGLELLSYAKALAKPNNGSVTAITGPEAGTESVACLARYGAEKVIIAGEDAGREPGITGKADIVRHAAEKERAEIVLFASTVTGSTLAPFVSAKLKAGMVPGVYSLPLNHDPFTITRKVFSGKAVATVTVKTPVKVLVLLPNSFPLMEDPVPLQTEIFTYVSTRQASPGIQGIRIVDTLKTDEQAALNEAGIVVSGGRGLKSRDNWRFVEELASLLGGATACSRPAYDEGWCPHDGYVGQTGKVISPKVYFALGISGAVQHLAGISSPKLVVAVNTDPEAPIFRHADYGIVGDIREVMPRIINAVKKFKENATAAGA